MNEYIARYNKRETNSTDDWINRYNRTNNSTDDWIYIYISQNNLQIVEYTELHFAGQKSAHCLIDLEKMNSYLINNKITSLFGNHIAFGRSSIGS